MYCLFTFFFSLIRASLWHEYLIWRLETHRISYQRPLKGQALRYYRLHLGQRTISIFVSLAEVRRYHNQYLPSLTILTRMAYSLVKAHNPPGKLTFYTVFFLGICWKIFSCFQKLEQSKLFFNYITETNWEMLNKCLTQPKWSPIYCVRALQHDFEVGGLLVIMHQKLFFSIWVFSHNHSRITGLQGKGEDISLTARYHFPPLHRHLDIIRAITAESLPLHIRTSRTRTGNLWFLRAVANH